MVALLPFCPQHSSPSGPVQALPVQSPQPETASNVIGFWERTCLSFSFLLYTTGRLLLSHMVMGISEIMFTVPKKEVKIMRKKYVHTEVMLILASGGR